MPEEQINSINLSTARTSLCKITKQDSPTIIQNHSHMIAVLIPIKASFTWEKGKRKASATKARRDLRECLRTILRQDRF